MDKKLSYLRSQNTTMASNNPTRGLSELSDDVFKNSDQKIASTNSEDFNNIPKDFDSNGILKNDFDFNNNISQDSDLVNTYQKHIDLLRDCYNYDPNLHKFLVKSTLSNNNLLSESSNSLDELIFKFENLRIISNSTSFDVTFRIVSFLDGRELPFTGGVPISEVNKIIFKTIFKSINHILGLE